MDEEETKNCPNCKREIPAVNFTIHTVHCARNIRVCPVCKEPIPAAELQEHHNKLHKLLPCKQCGESVCGTDLEDHIRDSCANTIKSCRFCELELPRREIPAHEGYCGVRTEQCPECREYVMIKYRQLHVDSNHGFIRLDDDPAPAAARKEPANLPRVIPASNFYKTQSQSANSDQNPRSSSTLSDAGPSNYRNGFLRNQARHRAANINHTGNTANVASDDNKLNGVKKRTNDQPQLNTNKGATNKIDKDLPISRGAVKKRPAPAPPRDPVRDMAYYSALTRKQREDKERMEQNIYNMAHGLPPVLSPAAKVEKLRKMDALQNGYRDPAQYRGRLVRARDYRDSNDDRPRANNTHEFKDLKPMSPEQFMARFNALQLQGSAPTPGARPGGGATAEPEDRFSEIKSSLRELRRGLNEVTAPYNNNNTTTNNNERRDRDEEIRLPCEFCNALFLADDLVQHQTGCRPDLAQFWRPEQPAPIEDTPAVEARGRSPTPTGDPLIPCEFCARPLPVYLINEHQERCAREVDILSAD